MQEASPSDIATQHAALNRLVGSVANYSTESFAEAVLDFFGKLTNARHGVLFGVGTDQALIYLAGLNVAVPEKRDFVPEKGALAEALRSGLLVTEEHQNARLAPDGTMLADSYALVVVPVSHRGNMLVLIQLVLPASLPASLQAFIREAEWLLANAFAVFFAPTAEVLPTENNIPHTDSLLQRIKELEQQNAQLQTDLLRFADADRLLAEAQQALALQQNTLQTEGQDQAALQEELASALQRIEMLNKELFDVRGEHNASQDKQTIALLEDKITELSRQLEERPEAVPTEEDDTVYYLNEKLRVTVQAIDHLEQRLKEALTELDSQQEQASLSEVGLKEELLSMQTRLETESEEKRNLEHTVTQLQMQLEQLTNQLKEGDFQTTGQLEDLQGALDRMAEERRQAESTLSSAYQDQLTEKDRRIEELQTEVAKQQMQMAEQAALLAVKEDDGTLQQFAAEELQKQLRTLEEQKAGLERIQAQMHEKLHQYEGQDDALRQALENCQQLSSQLDEFRANKELSQELITSLKIQNQHVEEELKRSQDAAQVLEVQVSDLVRRAERAEAAAQQAESALAEEFRRVATLQIEQHEAVTEKEEALRRAEEISLLLRQKEEALHQAIAQAESFRSQLETMQNEASRLEAELMLFRRQLEDARAEGSRQETIVRQLIAQKEALEQELTGYAEARQELAGVQERLLQKDQEIQEAQNLLEETRKQIADLQSSLSDAAQEAESLKKNLQETEAEKEEIRKRWEQERAELNALIDRLKQESEAAKLQLRQAETKAETAFELEYKLNQANQIISEQIQRIRQAEQTIAQLYGGNGGGLHNGSC